MKCNRINSGPRAKFPLAFFTLVFVMSAVVWSIGGLAERFMPEERELDLPLSALMFVCPGIAALILVQREGGWGGVKKLVKRTLNPRIKGGLWYVLILLLMPAIAVLQYGLMNRIRLPVPDPAFPVWMVPVSVLVFFIAALSEELGWQGYAIAPLQARWKALTASVVLGTVWAVWHVVPLIQLGRTPVQIAWQCMDMVATRIVIVWLFSNTGRSVFAAVLYHTMYNVSTVLLPNYGLRYDPMATSIVIAVVATAVTFLWGAETLSRYRYARVGS
jgi:membrane protease YdiL (CAAX protease family)